MKLLPDKEAGLKSKKATSRYRSWAEEQENYFQIKKVG